MTLKIGPNSISVDSIVTHVYCWKLKSRCRHVCRSNLLHMLIISRGPRIGPTVISFSFSRRLKKPSNTFPKLHKESNKHTCLQCAPATPQLPKFPSFPHLHMRIPFKTQPFCQMFPLHHWSLYVAYTQRLHWQPSTTHWGISQEGSGFYSSLQTKTNRAFTFKGNLPYPLPFPPINSLSFSKGFSVDLERVPFHGWCFNVCDDSHGCQWECRGDQ